MRNIIVGVVAVLLCISAQAQNLAEVRVAPDSEYRYLDWSYMLRNQAVIDVFYIGVPGANEFDLGGGYAWKAASGLTLTPLAYVAFVKEGRQSGVKLALLASFERSGWKVSGYIAHSFGQYQKYQVADTADFTRVLGKRFEVGISHGFFHQGKAWGPQTGPIVKWNDSKGSWAASYRFGTTRELRFGRVLTF